ncbi:MAG: AAA family ATPase [Bacteroidetes bacterium]|nr:AAA family ATPase [Bacteroidota bacterium]
MIQRTIHETLLAHFKDHSGIPLLITGAKRTGKTTMSSWIGESYNQMILLDMETAVDRQLFKPEKTFEQILNAVFFLRNNSLAQGKTLIFLREIQHCPEAISWFQRAAADSLPYSVVATASYISPEIIFLMTNQDNPTASIQIPPLTFLEFLQAYQDNPALIAFQEVPVPLSAYQKLLNYFHLYSLIGGMPEIVNSYMTNRNLKGLSAIYEDIYESILKSIASFAPSVKTNNLVSETFQNSFPFAATRIIFNHFGNSIYRSREIAGAFRTLEKHLLLSLVYPITSTTANVCDKLKSPRLQIFDTGMVNYFSGIQMELFNSHDMNAIFKGQIAKQVVGQEIAATEIKPVLNFWIRKKLQSTAEIDFVIPYNDLLIPVIVKSGEPGRLRSLHQFIDEAPHPYAVRLSAEKLSIRQTQTINGKKFYLLNLPYFLASKIKDHLKGFIRLSTG